MARVVGLGRVDDLMREAVRDLRRLVGPRRPIYHTGATQLAFLAPCGAERDAYVQDIKETHRLERERSSTRTIMTSAVGVTVFKPHATRPQDVLRALYVAAQEARSSLDLVSVYSTVADEAYQRRYRLLRGFGTALNDSEQLWLVFQPQIDLVSGRCVRAEALLRWSHPELGPISPGEFVPVVEHSPHVQAMTAFVLEAALAQARRWRDDGHDLIVSVNVSAANLHETEFASSVKDLLRCHGLSPERLELEVTESAFMQDAAKALQQLDAFAKAGIRLVIDDLGTGYSSIAYLEDMPAHVVKIDQSFVRKFGNGEKERSRVRSMIGLSQDFGYRVVAEGVETLATADLLLAMNCDEAQGYVFSRPLEIDQFKIWRGTNMTGSRSHKDRDAA